MSPCKCQQRGSEKSMFKAIIASYKPILNCFDFLFLLKNHALGVANTAAKLKTGQTSPLYSVLRTLIKISSQKTKSYTNITEGARKV